MRVFTYSLSIIISLFLFLSCGTESTPTYTLTTSVVGEGNISPSGGTYEEGEEVTLTSSPNNGWLFNNWSGDGSGTSNSITMTMVGNRHVTGNFIRKDYSLNITIVGEGTVEEQIVSQPKSTDYPYETVVELTPTPSSGWRFVEWSGDVTSTDEVIQVPIDGETNVTVTFQRKDYSLNITIVGEGTVEERIVSQPKSTDYPFETVVELTPTPNSGWSFVEWGGDVSGVELSKRITIDEEKNITVTFKQSLHLSDNGVTIMCPDGRVGDIGVVNGVEYEVVDRELLEQRRDEGKDLSKVCVSLVTDMSRIFRHSQFNQPISNWDVSNVTDMIGMFDNSVFNQPIGDWDLSSVTDMYLMFRGAQFNQPIGDWDVSSVTDMYMMFRDSKFNQPIGEWDVSSVTIMSMMFRDSQFNQPIGEWDVSSVENMSVMFDNSVFNQPIGNWDVSSVIHMSIMFRESQFKQPIGEWNVSSVENMNSMFDNSVFNQPIGNWDVSSVIYMERMFRDSQFNQNISNWCVSQFTSEPDRFSTNSPLTQQNKPKWGTCPD